MSWPVPTVVLQLLFNQLAMPLPDTEEKCSAIYCSFGGPNNLMWWSWVPVNLWYIWNERLHAFLVWSTQRMVMRNGLQYVVKQSRRKRRTPIMPLTLVTPSHPTPEVLSWVYSAVGWCSIVFERESLHGCQYTEDMLYRNWSCQALYC